MPTDEPKEEKRPKMPKVSKVTTRSMAKVIDLESKPEEPIRERASPVKKTNPEQDSLQETNEKMLRLTQEWDQGLPDEDMKKWAWGTGSAERYPPESSTRPGGGTSQTIRLRTTGGMTSCG